MSEEEEGRQSVDSALARAADQLTRVKAHAPLSEAEQMLVRFLIRDAGSLIDEDVNIGGGA